MGSTVSTKEDEAQLTSTSESKQSLTAAKSETGKKTAKKSTSKRPAAKKSTSKRPAAKKSTSKRPAAKKQPGELANTLETDGSIDTLSENENAKAQDVNGKEAASTREPDAPQNNVPAAGTEAEAKRKKNPRAKNRYTIGQQIVYPLQGVGRVERTENRDFQGQLTPYYVVYLEVSDMTIMIPVDKADSLGIRPIVSKRKAERALRLIAEDFAPIPTDWKLRYQMNLDLLKNGAVEDIASVVRSLSYRSRIKELPILERKLYDSAFRLLVDEVSYALTKEKKDIESIIEERAKDVKPRDDE